MAERTGVSREIGEALLRRQRRLFRWWHRVRDGTLSRPDFIELVNPLRAGVKAKLEAATALPIAKAEKTPLATRVRLRVCVSSQGATHRVLTEEAHFLNVAYLR